MNKFCQVVIICAVLFFVKCSEENNGNPVTPPPEVLEKDGTISSDESWSETDKIYRITDDCSIEAHVTWGKGTVITVDSESKICISNNGILTIEEGVKVKLGENAYFEVGKNTPGTLDADGSTKLPIIFEADTDANVWGKPQKGGIVLGDSAKKVRLNHCDLSGATAGIYVKTGSPEITDCKISSCKGNGIYFDSSAGPSDSITFTDNTISNCEGYPLTLPADKLGNLSGKITFSGFDKENNGIHILGALVKNEAAVWRKMDLPYIFSQMAVIGSFSAGASSVTIMPGVVCKFEKNAGIRIGDPCFGVGILIAKGTPEDSIFFINSSPDVIWGDSSAGGIWIGPESPVNTLFEFCSIQKATTGIYAAATTINVSNCRITGCDSNGITFFNGSPVDSTTFQNNFIVKNGGYGISIPASQLIYLSGSGSVADNGNGGIYVSGDDIWQSGTWKKHDVPYVVDGILNIGGMNGVEINIHPGAEFNFLHGAYIRIGSFNPGTFIAKGTDDLPIVFESYDQDEYWGADEDGVTGGIRIEKSATEQTRLKYCKIKKATSGIYVDANVKIDNCTIKNNKNYGIVIDKNAESASITGNSYSGNGVDSTYVVP